MLNRLATAFCDNPGAALALCAGAALALAGGALLANTDEVLRLALRYALPGAVPF